VRALSRPSKYKKTVSAMASRTVSPPPSLDDLQESSADILRHARERRRVLDDTHPLRRYSPSPDSLLKSRPMAAGHRTTLDQQSTSSRRVLARQSPRPSSNSNSNRISNDDIGSASDGNEEDIADDASSIDSFLRGLDADETEEKIKQLRLQLKARRYAHRIDAGSAAGYTSSGSEADTLSTVSSASGLGSAMSSWSDASWSLMPRSRDKRSSRGASATCESNDRQAVVLSWTFDLRV
jgi:hypothetical protein